MLWNRNEVFSYTIGVDSQDASISYSYDLASYKILHSTVHLNKDYFVTMNTNLTRTDGLKISL